MAPSASSRRIPPGPTDFARFVSRHFEYVTSCARRFAGTESDADDLVQDTFERAQKAYRRSNVAGAERAWLRRILRHRFIDGQRTSKASREEAFDENVHGRSLPPEEGPPLTLDDLRWAIQRLPSHHRSVIRLCVLGGHSGMEAARILKVERSTVHTRLFRARKGLRGILEPIARDRGRLMRN